MLVSGGEKENERVFHCCVFFRTLTEYILFTILVQINKRKKNVESNKGRERKKRDRDCVFEINQRREKQETKARKNERTKF